jgi:hypothetical protein
MGTQTKREQRIVEWFLILVAVAIMFLVSRMSGNKLVILNLFFLPVVLSGFFLGRYHAGIMALLCAIGASLVTVMQLDDVGTSLSPLTTLFSVTLWGAVLCLTAILVGTLSDERTAQTSELHEAYVGVIEVLSSYLQGGGPHSKTRTSQIAEQCRLVAGAMRLSPRQVDDIHVAALMQDIGKIEITTKVISKAMHSIEGKLSQTELHSFQGTDLVHSLGTILRGAIPILVTQDNPWPAALTGDEADPQEVPIGAKIIRAVRDYCALTGESLAGSGLEPGAALSHMRCDPHAAYDSSVLDALESVVGELEPVA